MPNAVCSTLLACGVRDLGVHTEMMTDGLAELYEAGRLAGTRKTQDVGKCVYTFALGSGISIRCSTGTGTCTAAGRLHQHATRDRAERPHGLDQQHDAGGSAGAGRVEVRRPPSSQRHRRAAAVRARGVCVEGRPAFICLCSTYDKRGERRSRIVLRLTPGNVVTTPRSDVMFVVTEYGLVNLKGKSVPERAQALIGIAHPDFRESLERDAYEHRLIPRGFTF